MRVYPDENDVLKLKPGDYGKDKNGWYCRPPIESPGMMGSLANHTVIEHEDGTITVSPSILITQNWKDQTRVWHGYLEKGVWREV